MKRTFVFSALFLAGAIALAGQTRSPNPELRPYAGVSLPIGNEATFLKAGTLFGIQGAIELLPTLTVVGSFGWSPGQDKYSVSDVGLDVLESNAGLEVSTTKPFGDEWRIKPFIGIGAGVRTYRFHDVALSDHTGAAGYGALGTEFQVGITALRLEARNNVFHYASPFAGGIARTATDVELSAGIAYHLR
ncbi:MAG: hypothetical protein HY700_10120 [Gemmatimonadetes bacterium]|nr:hypothetical protein [Gemmatimonadota bacterium]